MLWHCATDSEGNRVNLMGGSQPGEEPDQFTFLHSIATDSRGNLFAAEVSYTEIGQHGTPQVSAATIGLGSACCRL